MVQFCQRKAFWFSHLQLSEPFSLCLKISSHILCFIACRWLTAVCIHERGFLFLFRCVKDPTYAALYSPDRRTLRFKFKAFRPIWSNPVVYLQCQLVVCRAFDYSSRCYQGCVKRSKREASSGLESVIVVAGPIQLWEPGSEIRQRT